MNEPTAREKLLRATRACLLEGGQRACTVKAIARRAGVNHGLVHHYFGTKENMLVAFAEAEAERMHRGLGGARSPEEVGAFFRKTLVPNDEFARLVVELVALADQIPALRDTLRSILRDRRVFLAQALGIADRATATLVTAAVMGLSIQYNLDRSLPTDEVIARLLDAVVPQPPPQASQPLPEHPKRS